MSAVPRIKLFFLLISFLLQFFFAYTRPVFAISTLATKIDPKETVDPSIDQVRLFHCYHLKVSSDPNWILYFPMCKKPRLTAEKGGTKYSFTVSKSLIPTVDFWYKVYTQWSINDYVLHSRTFPNIMFEVYRYVASSKSGRKRQLKFIKNQKSYYRKLLMSMQSLSNAKKSFTGDMIHAATLLKHIKNPNKYMMAAQSLRTQRGQKEFIQRGLKTSKPFLKRIKAIFSHYKLPEDLIYLAFVESSFNLKAMSAKGASGIFQLMPSTAKQFLTINKFKDERNHPLKAARAAAKLLRSYYRKTNSWPTAITAYNHGIGSILRAIKRTGHNNLADIIKSYKHQSFGFASKNFYTEFLAMLQAIKYLRTEARNSDANNLATFHQSQGAKNNHENNSQTSSDTTLPQRL